MRNSGSHIHDVRSGPSCRSGVPRVPWPRDGTPLGATSVEVLETQRWIHLDDGQRGHGHSAISCANGLEGRGPSPWLPHTYGFHWACSSAPSLRSQHAYAGRNNSTQERYCSSPARAGRQELHPEWGSRASAFSSKADANRTPLRFTLLATTFGPDQKCLTYQRAIGSRSVNYCGRRPHHQSSFGDVNEYARAR